MKKRTTYYSVFVLASILVMSSCARLSNISITKRHYRGGYYVDLGSTKPMEQKTRESAALPPVVKIPTTTAQVEIKNDALKNRNVVDLKESPAITYTASKKKEKSKPANVNYYASTTVDYVAPEKKTEELAYVPYATSTDESQGSNASDVPYWLMIVLCIILPPLAVGLKFGIVDKFWISILLTLLFWIPGVIYALILVIE